MSLGYPPVSATLCRKARPTRNPFRATCLFAPPSPAFSSAVAGPSRLQGRPYSSERSTSPSRRTRTRNSSQTASSELSRPTISNSSTETRSSPLPLSRLSSTPPPPPSLLSSPPSRPLQRLTPRRTSLPLTSTYRNSPLAYSPPPRNLPKPPPWPRTTSVGDSPFPLHSQHRQLLTTLASSERSLILHRTISSSPCFSNATLAPSPSEPLRPAVDEEEVELNRDRPPPVVLHPEQEAILQKVLMGEHCFLSGSAGSGKSVLLRAIIAALASRGKKVGITATTGLAAQSLDPIEGKTIHGWSGILPSMTDPAKIVESRTFGEAHARWNEADVLIVDEISMMSDIFLNLLSKVGQLARGQDQPFGGVQIIFAGDFFQLPPVITDNSDKNGNKHFAFFSSVWKTILPSDRCHFLVHAHRQKDPRFAAMLDRMRFGRHTVRDVQTLSKLSSLPPKVYEDGITPTYLCAQNKPVDEENYSELKKLGNAEGVTYAASDSDMGARRKVAKSIERAVARGSSRKITLDGPAEAVKGLRKNTNLLDEIELKVGARVMVVQNHRIGAKQLLSEGHDVVKPSIELNIHSGETMQLANSVVEDPIIPARVNLDSVKENEPPASWLFNGMQGVIESFIPYDFKLDLMAGPPSKLSPMEEQELNHRKIVLQEKFAKIPVVRFTNGAVIAVAPTTTAYMRTSMDAVPQATRVQIPLKLAWAMSIHKSQGQTLDRVKMDLSGVWECGQAYVALSRCTSIDTLELSKFDHTKIHTDDDVRQFYSSFTSFTGAASERIGTQPVEVVEPVQVETPAPAVVDILPIPFTTDELPAPVLATATSPVPLVSPKFRTPKVPMKTLASSSRRSSISIRRSPRAPHPRPTPFHTTTTAALTTAHPFSRHAETDDLIFTPLPYYSTTALADPQTLPIVAMHRAYVKDLEAEWGVEWR